MGKPRKIPDWAVPAASLRAKAGPDGGQYLTGKFGSAFVYIFKNPEKLGDSSKPDFILCFAKPGHHRHFEQSPTES